jgi:hypothetical protein
VAYAIRIYETGKPEVLRYEKVTVGNPGPGEARVRHVAVGLNFEINQRYALKDAVKAHNDLESRKTTGSSIFVI